MKFIMTMVVVSNCVPAHAHDSALSAGPDPGSFNGILTAKAGTLCRIIICDKELTKLLA